MSPSFTTGKLQAHTNGLSRNPNCTAAGGRGTKTPASSGAAGVERTHARNPPAYQVKNPIFANTVAWCEENSRRYLGSPGPPSRQLSGLSSGSMKPPTIFGFTSEEISMTRYHDHGHVVVPLRSSPTST